MKRAIWGSLVCLFFTTLPLVSSPLEKIPLESWIYPAIDRLYTSGLFPQLHRANRPYTRGKVAQGVLDLRKKEESGEVSLSDWQVWLLDKLESEFEYDIKGLAVAEPKSLIKLNPKGVFSLSKEKDEPSLGRGQLFISGSWEWSNRFVFQTRGILDNRGETDPNFFAQLWKKGVTGMVDRGYGALSLKPFLFTMGRDYFRWGPAGDGLLLSSNAPALDFAGLDLNVGKFKFSFFATQLDTVMVTDTGGTYAAKRYLSGHRASFKHPAGWEIAISEMILYGGRDRRFELYYLNPVLPYYVEQFNHNTDDNSLLNFEFALTFWKDKEFYGELLIDDFQYDFVSEPHQTGLVLGSRLSDFLGWKGSYWNLEYARLGTYVYGQQKPWNRYTYHEVVLGNSGGPDYDRWRIALDYFPLPFLTLNIAGEYQRQGTMTADSLYPNPIPKGGSFPSGVVEKTWTGILGFSIQPDAHLLADFSFAYRDYSNFGHQSGMDQNAWSVFFRVEYDFWREFWFD